MWLAWSVRKGANAGPLDRTGRRGIIHQEQMPATRNWRSEASKRTRTMLARLITFWHDVRASLWALPVAAVLLAVAVAIAASQFKIAESAHPAWYLFSGDAGDVSSFLANLTTAMVTLATLVVSITMVVLTLAAQQLGPRLIASFMSDRKTQVALALFVGTAAYLLILLRISSGSSEGASNLALTFASLLVGLNVLVLPVFVHHLARSIVADNVIKRVGATLDEAVRNMLPGNRADGIDTRLWEARESDAPVKLPEGGYIQVIDADRLVSAAADNDAMIILKHRAGQHVLPGNVCALVRPGLALTDDLQKSIEHSVFFGQERTPVQDLEFSLRQLVEVGVRALSPGQNDPYTAIAVIDRIALSLRLIMDRGPPRTAWRDDKGKVRLLVPVSTFEGFLDAAFDQLRQCGAGHPSVIIRLAEKLAQLRELADAEQRPAIEKHLRLVLAAGQRHIEEPADRTDLERRVAAALGEETTVASA
jgi:uncharacterized membrane protein